MYQFILYLCLGSKLLVRHRKLNNIFLHLFYHVLLALSYISWSHPIRFHLPFFSFGLRIWCTALRIPLDLAFAVLIFSLAAADADPAACEGGGLGIIAGVPEVTMCCLRCIFARLGLATTRRMVIRDDIFWTLFFRRVCCSTELVSWTFALIQNIFQPYRYRQLRFAGHGRVDNVLVQTLSIVLSPTFCYVAPVSIFFSSDLLQHSNSTGMTHSTNVYLVSPIRAVM